MILRSGPYWMWVRHSVERFQYCGSSVLHCEFIQAVARQSFSEPLDVVPMSESNARVDLALIWTNRLSLDSLAASIFYCFQLLSLALNLVRDLHCL